MKKIILGVALVMVTGLFAKAQGVNYGEKVDFSTIQNYEQFYQGMKGKTEVHANLVGPITSVCQVDGCWMKVDKGEGVTMYVNVKDHKFALPKDIAGKKAVFTGVASMKTLTLEMLKRYATEEGKSREFINSIKEPSTELVFEATGITVL